MADQFRYKLLTDLTAKADPSDTDLFAVGNNGSSGLRKLTFASIANAIKTKLLSWTFTNLTTSSKTLPGAVNELNSKITVVRMTETVTNGFTRFNWPSGMSASTHRVVIVPQYGSGTVAWSYSVQLGSDIVVYVRIGSERPTDGIQAIFDAVFIKL